MSYRYADSLRAGSEQNVLILLTTLWHIPLLCIQRKTPDDGQRNCQKHVEFYSKNKFQKLVHLVGFIIRIYHDARSSESQILYLEISDSWSDISPAVCCLILNKARIQPGPRENEVDFYLSVLHSITTHEMCGNPNYLGPDENSRTELCFSVKWNRIVVKGWTNCESMELKQGFNEDQTGMLVQKLSSNDRSVPFQRLLT